MKKFLFYTMTIGILVSMISSCDGNGETKGVDNERDSVTAVERADTMSQVRNMTQKEKIERMNIDCANSDDCDEPVCETNSAIAHEFDEYWQFTDCIDEYYGTEPVPAAKKIPASEIATLVNIACDKYRIMYDLGTDNTSHDELEFRIAAGYPRPKGEKNSYSVAMFKGILARNPDTFHLFRGMGGAFGKMKTLMIMATKGNTIVYFGDLSDAFPTPPSGDSTKTKTKINK